MIASGGCQEGGNPIASTVCFDAEGIKERTRERHC